MQRSPDAALTLMKCTDGAQISIAAGIIETSFAKDQAMVHFVGDGTAPDTVRLDIVTAIVNAHFQAHEPIFLLLQNQHAIGAALVEIRRSPVGELLSLLRTWQLWWRLPKGCIRRLNSYRSVARRGCDKKSVYITMIGVLPDQQGRGFGWQFIELLERDVGSKSGWSLDTENPKNVSFYEKLGYALVNKVDWGANTIYQMHKSGT